MKTISDYLQKIERVKYDPEVKNALLAYMERRQFLKWISSARIDDEITGQKNENVCRLLYDDGEYEWSSSERYHLDKYNLKLSDEFIQHVMEQQ